MLDMEEFTTLNNSWDEQYGNRFDEWAKDDDNLLSAREFKEGVADFSVYTDWNVVDDKGCTGEEFYHGFFQA